MTAPGQRLSMISEKKKQKLDLVCSHPLPETNTWSADGDKGTQGHCRYSPSLPLSSP